MDDRRVEANLRGADSCRDGVRELGMARPARAKFRITTAATFPEQTGGIFSVILRAGRPGGLYLARESSLQPKRESHRSRNAGGGMERRAAGLCGEHD